MKKMILKILIINLIISMLVVLQCSTNSYATTIDDFIRGAQNFISTGEEEVVINEEEVSEASSLLYNILLGIGIVVIVAVGITLGIKFMYASIDEKAQIKEMLIAYVAGSVVILGAFGIWRLVANMLLSAS